LPFSLLRAQDGLPSAVTGLERSVLYPGSLKIRAAPLPNGSSWILPIR